MDKYGDRRRPQAMLDFHDLGPVDGSAVKRHTQDFVQRSRKEGLRRIRIVTGRGKHSRGEPLVGPQVRRTLLELQQAGQVASFDWAKVFEGGDGALDVELA